MQEDNFGRSKSGNWPAKTSTAVRSGIAAERAKEARRASHSACASAEPPARALAIRQIRLSSLSGPLGPGSSFSLSAIGRYCCKSRKSNETENLANADY